MSRFFGLFAVLLVACGPTVGDPCRSASDCGSGVCVTRDFAPNGACSLPCVLDGGSCPSGSACIHNVLGQDAAGCLKTCAKQNECREGYVCKSEGDSVATVCIGPSGT